MKVLFSGNGNNLSTYSRHAHEHPEIILTISGSAHAIYGGETYIAEGGHLALVPPNTFHSIKNGNSYSDLFVAIDAMPFEINKTLVLNDDNGMIKPLLRTLYNVWVQKEENYQQICDNLLGIIFELITKLQNNKNPYNFVEKLKNLLTLHLTDAHFQFKNAAAELGISQDYLRHRFKAETGMTPLEYLTHLRITQAQRYLTQKDGHTISEIAYLCGFSDPYYFSRCFKKLTGKSPKAYRTEC